MTLLEAGLLARQWNIRDPGQAQEGTPCAWGHADYATKGQLTLHVAALQIGIEPIHRPKQNLHMRNEALRYEDTINVGQIAHMEEHVRYASGRRLLKGREYAPNSEDLLLHVLLLLLHSVAGGALLERLLGPRTVPRLAQPHIPELVDHVALGVPVLVLAVPEYFDELLKDRRVAAIAPLGELRRVVVVAVDVAIVLVVAVRRPKDRRAHGASEVVHVVLAV